jgi:hypothetical protein
VRSPSWHIRLVTAGLWLLIATGPVLGAAAMLRPLPGAPETIGVGAVPVGVEGLGVLAVVAHLSSLPGQVTGPAAPSHPGLRPAGDAVDGMTGDQRTRAARAAEEDVDAAAVLSTAPAGPNRWGVTVGVIRSGVLESWQVTIASADDGHVVEGLPAPVGGDWPSQPGPGAPPPLRAPQPDDPLAVAVQAFAAAYLAGDGDLPRYIAAGTHLPLPSAPIERAELRRLASRSLDGDRVAVLAEIRIVRPDGAVHLAHYPLLMRPVDGRWEVVRLLPAFPGP